MIQQIPLNGGLVTQADAEEVGVNACTELINAEFDKPGLIYKRKGRATATSTSANINEISRWVAPDGTVYWILCATDGKVYRATSLGSLTELFDSTGTRVRVSNYGSMLRFANGIGYEPKVYQYIDRDFFWWDGSTYGYNTSPAFNIDRAIPQAIDFTLTQCGALVTDYSSTMAHSTKTYQYKITFVYDGNQETELPKLSAVNSTMALDASLVGNTSVFFFEILFAEADWNNRCTGINVYRREGSGAYYKVASASTLSREQDQNVQVANANAFTTKVLVDSANGLSSAVNGKELYVNGFTHTIATAQNAQFASMTDALIVVLSNTWGIIKGETNLTAIDDSGTSGNTTGGWFVGEVPTSGTDGIHMLTGSTSGWTAIAGSATFATSTAQKKYGSSSLEITDGGGGTANIYYNLGTSFTDSDIIIAGFWFKMVGFGGGSYAVRANIGDSTTSTGGSASIFKEIIDRASDTDWKYVQVELDLSTTSYTTGDDLYFQVNTTDHSGTDGKLYIDNLIICKKVYNSTGYLGFGSDVVASTSFDLGAEDSAKGWGVQVGGGNIGFGSIKNNLQYSFKHQASTFSASTTETVHINRSYIWQDTGTSHKFSYRDLDDANGIVHPTGETSLDVNFTYSVNLEGRQYVAGVALNPSAENEIHKDWVMFSKLNQPDVIPITNYISIPDLQGGEITGLARLMGDLVVLQSKGIYRLSVPSADPFSWSLSESEPNIGCVSADSIVEYDSGIFFAGEDNFYHLSSNFKAMPVTTSIKDIYQGSANLSNTKAIIDVKKNRLLCKFGDTNQTLYVLDLDQMAKGVEHWSKMDMSTGNEVDLFAIDENLKVYTVEADTTSYVVELNPSSSAESTSFKRTTGWITFDDLGERNLIRKLNLRYNSTDALTVKFYVDGDSSTAVQTLTIPADTSGTDIYRCKPGVRGKNFMIEVSTSATTNAVEIRKMELEIE